MREIALQFKRARQACVLDIDRRMEEPLLVRDQEKRVFQFWDAAAEGAAELVEIEIRVRVRGLRGRWRELRLSDLVLQCPGCKSSIFFVVEQRAVITVSSARRFDTNIRNAVVLGREIVRHDGDLAHGFERRLAACRLAEDAAVGALAVEREAGAVGLRADELEGAVRIALRDVRIEIQKAVYIAAVAR